MTARAEYIEGLRGLANALEDDPDLPLPFDGTITSNLTVFAQTKDELQAWISALPGTKTKDVNETSEHYGFKLRGSIAGLHILVHAPRDEVCTRRVVDTRIEVVEEEITQVIGKRSVPKTVEIVEWDCHPLLSEVAS